MGYAENMASAPAIPLVPVEEYLNTSYEPDVDYVDGRLLERNVGTQDHGSLQGAVYRHLHSLTKEFHFKVFVEVRLRVATEPPLYRIPDVMAVNRPYARGKIVVDVPFLVVEIKSPDDTLDDLIDRCLDYELMGVENIFVLDPQRRRKFQFRNSALSLVPAVNIAFPDGRSFPLPADELFTEVDE